jgi:hypothetical protein
LGKLLVFCKEPIAGMHRIGAGLHGSFDQFRDGEVALGRGSRTDRNGAIASQCVRPLLVRFGIHGDGLDCHLATRTHDPQRDLPTIGNQ